MKQTSSKSAHAVGALIAVLFLLLIGVSAEIFYVSTEGTKAEIVTVGGPLAAHHFSTSELTISNEKKRPEDIQVLAGIGELLRSNWDCDCR